MLNSSIITSWPLSLGQGSGTALFVRSIEGALHHAGIAVELINPILDTADYTRFTLERLWFNIQLASDPRVAQADWILGLDYDGFAIPRRPNQRFIATARAVFADLVDTEPEPFRTMLRTQAFFEGHNLRTAELVITPSEYARQKVIDYYQVAARQVHAVPNGIDLAEWDRLWASLPDPEPDRRPTLLAVSKLYPRKKIATLVRAAPLIARAYPDVDVRIVGAGFEWDALQRLTDASGARSTITWLSDIDDRRQVVAEFKRCHVFTHPSIQDAFANVCLESMASARPLVVSDAASMPAMVRAANSGLVVSPDDPEELAAAVCRLFADDQERLALGKNGRCYAEGMTWQRTAEQFIRLVQR